MGMMQEFKEFAMKGNVVDMAVGIIIGGAFGKIVSSLVADLIMPAVSIATGGMNFADLKYTLKEATTGPGGEAIEAVTLNYGNFIQTGFDFVILAFSIFMVIRAMNSMKREEEAKAEEAPPEPPKEEVLLTEIRDLLKTKA
ncbi:MAG: large-conductance mechanosensitive channel protein MscL [Vampirovibrio sp.]|nr:large-conductance mechanosensitive channel protein MscL [Vampirovibrio sp.]